MADKPKGRARGRARGNVATAEAVGILPVQAAGRASQRGSAREGQPGANISRQLPQSSVDKRGGGDDRGIRGTRVAITRSESCVKRGKAGRPLEIISNHLKIEHHPNYAVYQYRVDYSPDIESKKLKAGLLFQHSELFGEKRLFDGTMLFLPRKLKGTVIELTSIRKFDNAPVLIKISLKQEISPEDPMFVQICNIILRKMLRCMGMHEIMCSYFNPKLAQDPGHGLQVWPGISMTFEKFESSLLLNLDLSFKVLRKSSIYEMLKELRNRPGNLKEHAARELLGQTVMTKYNNKTYQVSDIDWTTRPSSTFEKKGEHITYLEYYQKFHDVTIRDHEQPMLVSIPKKKDVRGGMTGPIYLVPELCQLTGIPDEMKANFRVMSDLAGITRKGPEERAKELLKFRSEISRCKEAANEMKLWGFEFSKNLLKLTGRTLDPEKLFQSDKNRMFSYDPKTADWSRETRGQKLIKGVSLDNWLLVFTQRDQESARELEVTLRKVGPPMGMAIAASHPCRLGNDSAQSYKQTMMERVDSKTQLVMCIVPTNRKDRYDVIKKFCCVENSVPSQVVVSRTLSKKQMLMSVATKIAIQLNCKLGGETWGVNIPMAKLMVVGIDSYHDSAKKGRSVGALIANLNPGHTRYYSRCCFQTNSQEMMDGLENCFIAALKMYYDLNGFLPTHIIMYRDGVGDGQIGHVVGQEVPQFQRAIKGLGSDYEPKFGFVIVKKRHNTKLFANNNGRLSNPLPGTVVDSDVTKKEWFDFFLISQSVRQGTVGPTHYNVVYDELRWDADKYQRLSYKLTHLYYNWQGTIRVPSVCQYAHKLAFLVGQSLHEEPKLGLVANLYYL